MPLKLREVRNVGTVNMPFFNEDHEAKCFEQHHRQMDYIYSLNDSLERRIPVTSIEFNPPPVSRLAKQEAEYWLQLQQPDEEDVKILKALKTKLKALARCHRSGVFISITDSAAGILRMHNLTLLRLLHNQAFTDTWLDSVPIIWEQKRTILHLTRNHSFAWLRHFLAQASSLGFNQLLLITGDPLTQIRLKTVTAQEALQLPEEQAALYRPKNSIEMLHFIDAVAPDFFTGVCHNPFLRKEAAHKHLLKKVAAGARFIITQPVSYYEECWRVMADFDAFQKDQHLNVPVILGVFNYHVPCNASGYKAETFEKRYKFWKKLFGYVPEGVRLDYDMGLNGVEILARSINKLKRMGHFHFDVMNAERNGWTVINKGKSFVHELDRLVGVFDHAGEPRQ